jgi:hypothetical protein
MKVACLGGRAFQDKLLETLNAFDAVRQGDNIGDREVSLIIQKRAISFPAWYTRQFSPVQEPLMTHSLPVTC